MRHFFRRRRTAAISRKRPAGCPTRLRFETLEPRLVLSGTGLTAQYFHNSDFTGLAETRTEAIDHNWDTGSPAAGVDADSFSVRWTGQIEPEFSELYSIRVLSDEGVRVWIDGELVIDDWKSHPRRFRSGTIALQAGQRYDMRVDYREETGTAEIELSWSSASRTLEIIPAERLYASPAGLLGSYRDTTGGTLTRIDAMIDFDWGLSSPDPVLDADDVTVTWTGQIRADFSDEYTFSTISDDGVRLWVGGELVIDNWTNHTATEDMGSKMLEAGKWYDVRLDYYEDGGPAEIEWRWSSARQTAAGVFEVVPEQNLQAAKATPVVFQNPLGPGADPYVVRHDGYYYMTRTYGNRVMIERATSLENIHASTTESETVLAWNPPDGTNYSHEIWAPELHRLGDNWYVYVAASDGNNATHRMHVLERTGPDPFGPYVYKGQIAADTDRWAIDGTVLEWQGDYYFVWSGWPGFSDGVQNLYIAEMGNPWTLRGERVLISTPEYSWEKHGLWINEGPQILVNDGQLHIIYSASGFWTHQYALGRLTYDGTGSLLNAASWTKSSVPVFSRTSQVVGTGHASFTKNPDGTEDWIVYHAHGSPTDPARVIHIQPFTYFANGTPNFGSPLPPGQWIAAPATGADPERPFLPGDYNADGVVDALDFDTFRATFEAASFPGSAADGNGNGAVDAADYTIWRDNLGAHVDAAALLTEAQEPVPATAAAQSVAAEDDGKTADRAASAEPLRYPPPLAGSPRDEPRVIKTAAVDVVFRDWRREIALANVELLRRVRREPADAISPGDSASDWPSSRLEPVEDRRQRELPVVYVDVPRLDGEFQAAGVGTHHLVAAIGHPL